jgi:hypothetical protein
MNPGTARHVLALVLLIGSTLAALLMAPLAAWRELGEPTTRAGVLMVVTVLVILSLRRFGKRTVRLERQLLCIFLAAMPLVYLESGLWHGAKQELWLEGVGFLVFGGWALLAYRRDATVLAAGIAAHGLLWDSWHHDADFIHSWYARACLVVDLGWAAYVWLQRDRLAWDEPAAQPQAAKQVFG